MAVATKNSRIIRERVGMHQWRCTFLWPKNDWTQGQKRKGRGSRLKEFWKMINNLTWFALEEIDMNEHFKHEKVTND